VMDVLRRRRSLAWVMDDASNRAAALGVLAFVWDWPVERIAIAAAEDHGPGALSEGERGRLAHPVDLAAAPPPVRGDYPDWLDPHMARVFGDERALEGAALAARAPLDLRVNTLKTDLARALKALAPFNPETPDLVQNAIRIPAPKASERAAAVETAPEFEKGWFEVQDLGSQWAATMAGDIKGRQVLDLCAGGGGKTLALAAAMANTGQLYAYDSDARRLTDTVRRAQRAGVRNLQVRSPIHPDALAGLEGRMDVVFVDAPCTGSGTWRRHPDTKWRVTPEQLLRRTKEQDEVLLEASLYVKPSGWIVYVTCSLLSDENEDRIKHFITNRNDFGLRSDQRLSPRLDNTDGFYSAVVVKS
jgi:16S rRNA (cytosine967-C5)-methyltransferase